MRTGVPYVTVYSSFSFLFLHEQPSKQGILVLMHLCYRKKSRTFPSVSGNNQNMPKRLANQIQDNIIQSICLLSYKQV